MLFIYRRRESGYRIELCDTLCGAFLAIEAFEILKLFSSFKASYVLASVSHENSTEKVTDVIEIFAISRFLHSLALESFS
jgi:hypothetical protein